MPLSNTTQEVLRSSPYWDDYNRDKRFHRILIKPKTPVQTRELNQMQSMLQNQVEQVTSSIYREGAAVSGGQQIFSNNTITLQVVRDETIDINNLYDAENAAGALIEGLTSGARAIVTQVSLQPSSSYAAILFAPLNALEFTGDESVQFFNANTGDSIATMTVAPANSATTVASTFSVDAGVFYLRGHLVDVPKQTVILDTTSATPSKRVGFIVAESIITSTSDGTLLDPALGSTNYAAPGADRLRLSAVLTAKDVNDDRFATNNDEQFIELVRIIEGIIQPQSDRLQQNFIEDTLARRTYDESGDYVVKPFRLLVKDHNPPVGVPNITGRVSGNSTSTTIQGANTITTITLANGVTSNVTTLFVSEISVGDILIVNGERREVTAISSNTALTVNGAFTEDFTNAIGTVVSADKVNIELETGKAYVRGYEIGTTGTLKLAADRARTTENVNNGKTSTAFGPYVIVNQNVGLFNINQLELVHLHSLPYTSTGGETGVNAAATNSTAGSYFTSKIGTAFARSFTYHSGLGDANTTYKLYLVNAEFETKTFQVNTTSNASDNDRLAGNSTVNAVTVDATAKTVRLRQNSASTAGGVLAQGDHAYVGATLKLYTYEGFTLSYPILASNSIGDGVYLRDHILTLDSDEALASVNATANVQVIFNDKCIRGISNPANNKNKFATVSIFSRVGFTTAGNTVLFGSNATGLLFRYREGVIDPSSITDETYEVMRYVGSVTGNDSASVGNVVFVVNSTSGGWGAGEEAYPQTTGVWEYVAATITSNNRFVPLNAASGDVSGAGVLTLGIPNTAFGSGYTSGDIAINLYVRTVIENATARTKTLFTANTNLSSVVVNATGNLVSNVSVNYKGHIAINNINSASSRIISLGVPDVAELKKVYAVIDANTIATNASAVVDVTDNYTLDSGQRTWCYDYASLVLKPTASHYTINCSQLLVMADVFSHSAASAGLGYFTPESYSGYDVENIPVFTDSKSGQNFRLSNYVDFRPVRTANTASANTAVNPYTNAAAYTFETTVLPYPSATYQADYNYYLPRVDKVVLTKNKEFKIITGTPSNSPQPPSDDPDGITLYILSFPAYTAFPQLVNVKPFEYKRYTMKDIRQLEKRIEGLEYYAALSTMDLQALNNPELDEYDNERFKNGIVTDMFTTDAVVNYANLDTKVSLDHKNQELRPRATVKFYDLDPDVNASSNVVRFGGQGSGLISLPYTSVPFVTQGAASKSVNINPFNVFSWIGSITLYPSSDTWIDNITKPDLVTNLFNENDGIRDGETIETSYNYWETTVTGRSVQEEGVVQRGYFLDTDPGNPHPEDQWATNGVRLQELTGRAITTTDTTTTARTTETIFTHTRVSTVSTDLGERIVDTSIAPYMRGIDVDIAATGLLPGAKLRATFDDVDVTAFIERANRITIPISSVSLFEIGDKIVSTSGGRARVVGIVRDTESNVGYLYVVDAVGIFTGTTISNRENVRSLGFNTLSGVSVNAYQHNHGRVTGLTDSTGGTFLMTLDTGAPTSSADYVGKTIYFSDGGSNRIYTTVSGAFQRYGIAGVSTLPPNYNISATGMAGLSATITAYSPSTRVATITATSSMAIDRLARQAEIGTTGWNPIRYSIGALESTSMGDINAVAVSPGSFFGMFRLPGIRKSKSPWAWFLEDSTFTSTPEDGPQFNTGTRVLRLENDPSVFTETSASTGFTAQGSTVTKQRNIVRTRQVDVWRNSGGLNTNITSTSTSSTQLTDVKIRYLDPLAQTFIVDVDQYPYGTFITHVDLFFARKGRTGMDVTVELRATDNGFPSADKVLSAARVSSGDIKVVPAGVTPNPGNANHYTRFTFDTPTYLAPNQEYAVVVLSNSNEYEVFVGEIGQKLIGSDKIISQQPHGGVLFKSQNSRTWVPEPLEDLMFVLHRAEFQTIQGTLAYQLANTAITPANYDTVYVNADYLDFPPSSKFTAFSMTTINTSSVATARSITPRTNINLAERMRISGNTAGSYKLRTTFRTANSHVSPIFDTERVNTLFIENIIDNGRLYANGFLFTPGTPNSSASGSYSANGNSYALTISGGNGANAVFYAITNTSGYVTSVSLTGANANSGYGYTETPTVTMPSNTHFTTQPTFTYVGETSASSGIVGEQKARYITRTINLADGFDAGDLKVYISAVRAPQHNIDVYYKVLSTGDTQRFDDKLWTRMILRDGQETTYSSTANERKEYEYRTSANSASYTSAGVTYDRFHTFAIKIVLRSQQSANAYAAETTVVPRVSNLRILALDE